MRDTFPCICKYVVLSNTDLNIIRSLSARVWPAGTGNSVLLLLSSPSIRRTVVLVSSSPSGHRPVCIAVVKLTQWTTYDYEKSHWTCYFGTCRSDIHCV